MRLSRILDISEDETFEGEDEGAAESLRFTLGLTAVILLTMKTAVSIPDEVFASRIHTVIAAVITSNLRLAAAPGNVLCRTRETGLPRDSVVNVSQLITADKSLLTERAGILPGRALRQAEVGLRLVPGL